MATPGPLGAARLHLICLPYAGGGASIFRTWQDGLPADVEVCPIQLPGREGRLAEAPFTSLEPLVEAMLEAIGAWLERPFALFGHSMGALIAWEAARALRRRGAIPPVHLFVAGLGAPHTPNPDPPIHELPDDRFLARIRSLDGTPDEVFDHPELVELLLPTLRADFTLCETARYVEETPLAVPLTAIGGLADRKVSRERLEAWRVHTSAGFRLRMLPGDHFFLNALREPLLEVIAEDLARAPAR